MSAKAVRMNITLPEEAVKILKKRTKSGEKSSYIAEAIIEFDKKQSKKQLITEMIEGYIATSKEAKEIADDWDVTLNDGLDDEY